MYRRMLGEFNPMLRTLHGRNLTADRIVRILRECTHPEKPVEPPASLAAPAYDASRNPASARTIGARAGFLLAAMRAPRSCSAPRRAVRTLRADGSPLGPQLTEPPRWSAARRLAVSRAARARSTDAERPAYQAT
jgi:hypothetical protein